MKIKVKWIVSIFLLLGIIWFFPHPFMNHHPDAAKIVLFNGNTGRKTEITEPEKIFEFIDILESAIVSRTGLSLPSSGFSYSVTISNENDEVIKQFTIMSPTTIKTGGIIYKIWNYPLYEQPLESNFSEGIDT